MFERFGNDEIKAVTDSIKNASFLSGYTNKYLGGEDIQKFEKEFAKYHGCKFGIAVNSGTSALFVAQKAAGVSKKDKVLVPSLTFTATISQVLACNATPVFTDIDKLSYCMDFNSTTSNARFAIPVHLLGHPCKNEMIKEMKEKKMFVIEDCAQAMGAKSKGKIVGSMGDCGIFSFQETKHITTLGEGGMIITNNDEFAEKCRRIRNHGEYYRDDMNVGYNFRMLESQGSFGRVQLKKLPKILKTFKENAQYVMKNLPPSITPPNIPKDVEHAYMILGCKFNENLANIDRNTFLEHLTKKRKKILEGQSKSDIKGINMKPGKVISEGYRKVQYETPLYKQFTPKKKCLVSEEFIKSSLFMDIHRWRSQDEIDEELSIINKAFKKFS